MKNKCERKEEFLKEGWQGERVKGKNGVDRAAMKFQAEDSLEKIKGLDWNSADMVEAPEERTKRLQQQSIREILLLLVNAMENQKNFVKFTLR